MKELDSLTLVEQLYVIKNMLLDEMRTLNYAKNTIDLYSREIDHFINFCTKYDGEISYKEIIRPIILEAISYREKQSPKGKISPSTKDIFILALKRFFKYVQENIYPYRDYMKMFDRIKIRKEKKEKQYLNDEEIKRLLEAVEKHKARKNGYNAMRDALLVKLLLFGGLRISEALNLKFEDIGDSNDPDVYKIRVMGKGNKEASVYIRKSAIEDEITELLRKKRAEHIFITRNGRVMTPREARSAVEKFYRRAGIAKSGLHLLRHTLAMKLVREGVDIVHIQRILRHSNITTTTIYARSTERDMVRLAKEKI